MWIGLLTGDGLHVPTYADQINSVPTKGRRAKLNVAETDEHA